MPQAIFLGSEVLLGTAFSVLEDARFNSEAVDYLKDTFENLLNIKLHCDDEGGVGSETLLSGYRIMRSDRQARRSSMGWLGSSADYRRNGNEPRFVHDGIPVLVDDPEKQPRFRPLRNGQEIRDKPWRGHDAQTVDLVARSSSRCPCRNEEMSAFKFFKRDILLPACARSISCPTLSLSSSNSSKGGRSPNCSSA